MYLWSDKNLIGNCTVVHFFEDNPAFGRKIDFSITFDIKVTGK